MDICASLTGQCLTAKTYHGTTNVAIWGEYADRCRKPTTRDDIGFGVWRDMTEAEQAIIIEECAKQYGIAFTVDGRYPNIVGGITGWKQKDGRDQVFTSYAVALEDNRLDGWRGYVRLYPSGKHVHDKG